MAKDKIQKSVLIKNKKASFEFSFIDTYSTGVVLKGTEVKSVRQSKVSLGEAYCFLERGEVFIKGMNIAVYDNATHYNHEPTRVRKLLLQKKEIAKIENKMMDQGVTLVPIRLYINDKGLVKIDIAVAKGKNLHDKRESIKSKDVGRDLARVNY